MSKLEPLIKDGEKKVTEEELTRVFNWLVSENLEDIKHLFQAISMLSRGIDGLPVEPQDIFSGMLNIKDVRERTRFPNRLALRRHIYLRFMAKIWPETAEIWEAWADEEAHEYISYPHGEGRKEGVEIMKAKGMIAHGIAPIYLGEAPQPTEKSKGRLSRLFNRQKENEMQGSS